MSRQKAVGVFVAVGLVLPLLSTASAQAFAGLILSPSSARPGDAITATGTGATYATGTGINAVSIRLSTRNGQQLQTATPDSSNNFSTTFPVPAGLTPGTYLILATQTNTNGRQHAFTPGRAKLVILAGARGHGAATGGVGRGRTDGGLPLPLWVVALSVILALAGGSRAAQRLRPSVRRRRPSARPRLGS